MKLKIIVTEFSEFSENQFRKTLLNWLLANTLKTGCIFIWNYMIKSKHKRPLDTCLKIDVVTVGHSVHRGVSDLWSGGVSATPLHSDIPGRPPRQTPLGTPPGQSPPWADTLLSRHPLDRHHLLGRHPLLSRYPLLGRTCNNPYPVHAGIHTCPCPVHAGIQTAPLPAQADGTHPTGMHSCYICI